MARIVFLLCLLFLLEIVEAHEPLHEQIDEATAEIKKHPHDTDVLIKRGRLRLKSGAYDDAIDDFKHMLAVDPDNNSLHYYLTEAYFAKKNTKLALLHIEQFMHHATNNGARSRGFELIGRIHMQAKNFSKAIKAYQQLVRTTRLPKPQYYLALANAHVSVGKSNMASAIGALDQGMRSLGLLPVLQKRAIEYELLTDNPNNAIQRVDTLIIANPQSFAFLKLKADILWRLERKTEAKSLYKTSLSLLEKLPNSRKTSPAIDNLRKAMETRL